MVGYCVYFRDIVIYVKYEWKERVCVCYCVGGIVFESF